MTDMTEASAQPTSNAPDLSGSLPRTGPAMISMRGISKFYVDQKPALNNVDVEINSGEFVFIDGHSGSGKSTFIRLLLRELLPTNGQIIVAGQDLAKMKSWNIA